MVSRLHSRPAGMSPSSRRQALWPWISSHASRPAPAQPARGAQRVRPPVQHTMSSSERSATVKASDMTEDMQQDATGTAIQVGAIGGGGAAARRQSTYRGSDFRAPRCPHARPQALDKFTIEKDVAAYIKKEFDSKHGPTWHCIVGRNFGACTHCRGGGSGRQGGMSCLHRPCSCAFFAPAQPPTQARM